VFQQAAMKAEPVQQAAQPVWEEAVSGQTARLQALTAARLVRRVKAPGRMM
jgi:hypothetical protein